MLLFLDERLNNKIRVSIVVDTVQYSIKCNKMVSTHLINIFQLQHYHNTRLKLRQISQCGAVIDTARKDAWHGNIPRVPATHKNIH